MFFHTSLTDAPKQAGNVVTFEKHVLFLCAMYNVRAHFLYTVDIVCRLGSAAGGRAAVTTDEYASCVISHKGKWICPGKLDTSTTTTTSFTYLRLEVDLPCRADMINML